MCNIFSGFVVVEEGKNWGKVVLGKSMVHHEEDRPAIEKQYGSKLVCWETENIGDFSSFIITHDSGQMLSSDIKANIIDILVQWGKGVSEETKQLWLAKIAVEDEDYDVRREAVRLLTDKKLLAKIAVEDEDYDVRIEAVSLLTDKKLLAKIAVEDDNWLIRQKAVSLLTDKKLLAKIAVEDEDYDVRIEAVSLLTDKKLLAKIAVEDKSYNVRHFADTRLTELKKEN